VVGGKIIRREECSYECVRDQIQLNNVSHKKGAIKREPKTKISKQRKQTKKSSICFLLELKFHKVVQQHITGKVLCSIPASSADHTKCRYGNKKNKHLIKYLFSRTTWVSQHQKGSTILNFNEARNE